MVPANQGRVSHNMPLAQEKDESTDAEAPQPAGTAQACRI
jgi:hypothetical protein